MDLSDWERRMLEDEIGGDRFFFIILGQRDLRLWEGDPTTGRVAECTLRTKEEQ
jgi:hypothetical protein